MRKSSPTSRRSRRPKGAPIRAVGYARDSIHHAGKVTIAAQDEAIGRVCRERGWELVGIEHDLGRSGARGVERPGFDRARARIARGDAEVLVVFKLDRASRSVLDFVTLLDELRGQGGGFVSAMEPTFDTTNAGGKAMMLIAAVFAEMERDAIRMRAREVAAHRCGQGLAPGGRLPYGYRRVAGRFVADDAQAKVIRRMVGEVVAGTSLRKLCRILNDEQVPLPDGNDSGRWQANTVRKILVSPVIAGLRRVRDDDGAVVDVVPAVDGDGLPAWEAILPVDAWQHVQTVLSDPARRVVGDVRQPTLLSGLLVCDLCGHAMRPRNTRYGLRYRCAGNANDASACQRTSILAADAEPFVLDELWKVLAGRRIDPVRPVADADDVLDALYDERAELNDMYERGELNVTEYRRHVNRVNAVIGQQEAAADSAVRSDSVIVKLTADGAEVRDVWEFLPVQTRRAVIREAFEPIRVRLGVQGKRVAAQDKLEVRARPL